MTEDQPPSRSSLSTVFLGSKLQKSWKHCFSYVYSKPHNLYIIFIYLCEYAYVLLKGYHCPKSHQGFYIIDYTPLFPATILKILYSEMHLALKFSNIVKRQRDGKYKKGKKIGNQSRISSIEYKCQKERKIKYIGMGIISKVIQENFPGLKGNNFQFMRWWDSRQNEINLH